MDLSKVLPKEPVTPGAFLSTAWAQKGTEPVVISFSLGHRFTQALCCDHRDLEFQTLGESKSSWGIIPVLLHTRCLNTRDGCDREGCMHISLSPSEMYEINKASFQCFCSCRDSCILEMDVTERDVFTFPFRHQKCAKFPKPACTICGSTSPHRAWKKSNYSLWQQAGPTAPTK